MWRISRGRRAAFDGEGARLFGGRWNVRGSAVVYTAESLALAALEFLVHLEPSEEPADLVAVPANIPHTVAVERVAVSALPRDWRRSPPPDALAEIGATWLARRRTAVLIVPSAIVPEERDYLLNPAHPDFGAITVGRPRRFALDPRLRKHGERQSR